MARLAWATDIHLDFLDAVQRAAFADALAEAAPDAVALCGDIANARTLSQVLHELEARLARPIYFVLGNHDFYRGSIAGVRAEARALSRSSRWLRWLPDAGAIELAPGVGLIGHDGWSDGRLGDYAGSRVMLNDYRLIEELAFLDPATRLARLNALGDEAAAFVRAVLPAALERFRRVVFVTHVPPYREACWHEGGISDDAWLPHFSCEAVGLALTEAMRARPDRELLVLCGHTHGAGVAKVLPNLEVRTGGAEYGAPRLQGLIEVA